MVFRLGSLRLKLPDIFGVLAMFGQDCRIRIRQVVTHILALAHIAVDLRNEIHWQRALFAAELPGLGKIDLSIMATVHAEAVDLEARINCPWARLSFPGLAPAKFRAD
jgi:hypothetical protein